MNSVPVAISLVIVLAVLLVGIMALSVLYFGPLPRKSPKRFAAGVIAVASVLIIMPAQVAIEARTREKLPHYGMRFSNLAIIIEGTICLALLFYAVLKENRDRGR